jgi:hypothetical protein
LSILTIGDKLNEDLNYWREIDFVFSVH